MIETKNLLVLGANGFLGKNLVSKLNKTTDYDIYQLNGKNDLDLTKDNPNWSLSHLFIRTSHKSLTKVLSLKFINFIEKL